MSSVDNHTYIHRHKYVHDVIYKIIVSQMQIISWYNINVSGTLDALSMQGSTLRVNLWPSASKNSKKQLRASRKRPQLVLQGQ